jgi:hypothetical protein
MGRNGQPLAIFSQFRQGLALFVGKFKFHVYASDSGERLSQILGPAGTGWMISVVKASFGDPTAYATAFGIGALWLMLSAALVTCVRLPVPVGNQIRTAIEQRN